MSYNITITDITETEISDAYNWYNQQKTNLGNSFKIDFINKMAIIKDNPFLFQVRYLNIRITFLDNFPYGIHFFIENNTITILSVYHTSRKGKNI